ncbi:hypothetical protein NC653_034200 [Populus alba x Populus x berolinensis]|uniref:Uncharacterized protein n=1 Tax=Populus alba x Populus x berolinensis TaxID=444605 RepID=A0AAD6PVY8_9ROSI|nr:hypothetical protein NC653_034200 [Populus alba x Populus x berolinensis]
MVTMKDQLKILDKGEWLIFMNFFESEEKMGSYIMCDANFREILPQNHLWRHVNNGLVLNCIAFGGVPVVENRWFGCVGYSEPSATMLLKAGVLFLDKENARKCLARSNTIASNNVLEGIENAGTNIDHRTVNSAFRTCAELQGARRFLCKGNIMLFRQAVQPFGHLLGQHFNFETFKGNEIDAGIWIVWINHRGTAMDAISQRLRCGNS